MVKLDFLFNIKLEIIFALEFNPLNLLYQYCNFEIFIMTAFLKVHSVFHNLSLGI